MYTALRTLALCFAVAATLAGCGAKSGADAAPSGAVATGDEAVQAAGASLKPRPGHWDVKLEIKDFAIPGMPDSVKQTIAKQMDQAGAIATCLTPEEAARNDGKFFGPRNKNCTYQDISMANGQLAAKMTCTERGMKQTVEMRGSYGTDAYDIALNSQGDMNGQPMKMAMNVTGKRAGDCTGKEKN